VSCPTTCQSITASPGATVYVTFECARMPATPN
jgi:hypothetical protein